MKNIKEITKEELDNLKAITFDIDGVIAPIGTKIKETIDEDSIDLYMESKKLSDKFIQTLKKLIFLFILCRKRRSLVRALQ